MRRCVLINLHFSLLLVLLSAEISEVIFEAHTLCDFLSRMNSNCSELAGSAGTGVLDCARSCAQSETCHGLSADSKDRCYHHQSCPSLAVCEYANVNHQYFRKLPCFNGGTWHNATNSCHCAGGWVGSRCSNLPEKCLDLLTGGYPIGYYDRIYLKPPGVDKPFRVDCQLKETFTDTLLARNALGGDNNRTWEDFKSGFYDAGDRESFWVGLNNMAAAFSGECTKRTLNVYVSVYTMGTDMSSLFWTYDNVQIAEENEGFALTFSASSLPILSGYDWFNTTDGIEDCLATVNGSKFTTYDVDNDEDPDQNCAASAGTGWWFKSCSPACNPFGRIYSQENPEPITDDRIRFPGFNIRAMASATVKVILMLYDKL